MSDERERNRDRDRYAENIPRPDPSRLTTEQYERGQQQTRREIEALRELLFSEINALEKIHAEKFTAIADRFIEQKEALDTAMISARALIEVQNKANAEAAEKSERGFTKQLEALDQQTKTVAFAQSKEIADIRERLVGGEREKTGATDNTARLMTVGLFIFTIAMGLYATMNHNGSTALVAPAVIPVQPK